MSRLPLLMLALALLACSPSASAQRIFGEAEALVPPEVERIYSKGLDYLANTQQPEGTWPDGQSRQPGVVGLAVLAFLAHGDDPNYGPYREAVKRGLDYILKQQADNGYIGSSMYNHGFATLALAEAYGAVDDERLGPALAKAVELLLNSQAQNPLHAWRYSPDSKDGDTTVSGACLVALFAARNAGIPVPDTALEQALEFFRKCQGPDGGFGYTYSGPSSPPRAAIGTLVLALGAGRNERAWQRAWDHLLALGHTEQGGHLMYYLYYAAQAIFHGDPEAWNKWNSQNIQILSARQADDGSWSSNQGATFGTSTALLSLALNYRFLPIYER